MKESKTRKEITLHEKVIIPLHIEEEVYGMIYSGHFTIGLAKLDYEIGFLAPLHKRFREVPDSDESIYLSLWKEEEEIDLSEEETRQFILLLMEAIINFYGDEVGRKRCPSKYKADVQLHFYADQPSIEILNSPRFGCNI